MKPMNIISKLNESNTKTVIKNKNKSSLKEDNSSRNYKYIDSSEMNDCVYNSLSNTDVIDILDEVQRYFNESAESIKEFNKNSYHDTGMSSADIRACELGSKLIDQIKEAFDKAWQ